MNAQPTALAANKQNRPDTQAGQEIDLMALLGALIDRKYFIIALTVVFMAVGVVYAVFSTPVYQATAMIQVEESGGSVPGFDDMAGMFESTSAAVTEIELLKSRSVIGEAVDILKLDVIAEPKLFPFIGSRAFRKFSPMNEGDLAEPSFGATSYAWGGESIDVFRFDVPTSAVGREFTLVAQENNSVALLNDEGEQILTGKVGQELTNGKFNLTIRRLNARTGTEFTILRKDRLNTILDLQADIGASEKGKDSGIINFRLQTAKPHFAE